MNYQELMKITAQFRVIEFAGKTVVVKPNDRGACNYPDANFCGTGLALCGVLRKGETLQEFRNRYVKIITSHAKN
jgi:hypothetical protein